MDCESSTCWKGRKLQTVLCRLLEKTFLIYLFNTCVPCFIKYQPRGSFTISLGVDLHSPPLESTVGSVQIVTTIFGERCKNLTGWIILDSYDVIIMSLKWNNYVIRKIYYRIYQGLRSIFLLFAGLGFESRTSHMLSKDSTTELQP
jgi:hypothetical protein